MVKLNTSRREILCPKARLKHVLYSDNAVDKYVYIVKLRFKEHFLNSKKVKTS